MPHQMNGPHHGPGGMPGHIDGPEWFANNQRRVTRDVFADYLQAAAEALRSSEGMELNHVRVEVPDFVDAVLRYERTPKGTFALILRAEWYDADMARFEANGPVEIRPLHHGLDDERLAV